MISLWAYLAEYPGFLSKIQYEWVFVYLLLSVSYLRASFLYFEIRDLLYSVSLFKHFSLMVFNNVNLKSVYLKEVGSLDSHNWGPLWDHHIIRKTLLNVLSLVLVSLLLLIVLLLLILLILILIIEILLLIGVLKRVSKDLIILKVVKSIVILELIVILPFLLIIVLLSIVFSCLI